MEVKKFHRLRITNIHKRVIRQPKARISILLDTLSTSDDKLWPIDRWPAMQFNKGLAVGSHGGHGPIRYSVKRYVPGEFIEFEFMKPKGFNGTHGIEITILNKDTTEVTHFLKITFQNRSNEKSHRFFCAAII